MSATAVSVIVTARNEPLTRLQALLGAVADQDFDGGIELVIAVPPEERPTLAPLVPKGAVRRILLVENPEGDRSRGLNRAIHRSSSPTICRIDARSVPPPDYVRKCAARLASDPHVGIVGGVQSPRPRIYTIVGRGIARALSNPWLLGAPAYRRPGRSGPVDTVYLGSYRRDDVVAIGGYDVRLDANEDFDLARRYREAGWTVWLEADLDVGYEPRGSLMQLFCQYHAFGRSKVRFWRLRGERPNARQTIAIFGAWLALLAAAASLTSLTRFLVLTAGGLLVLAAVDVLSRSEDETTAVRAASVVASGVVLAAWLSGVAREALRRGGQRGRHAPDGAPRSPRSDPSTQALPL